MPPGGDAADRASAVPRYAKMRFALLGALILVFAVGVATFGVPDPKDVAANVGDLGVLGPLVMIVGSALLLLALVPRSVLAAAAGLMFGPLTGTAYVLAGVAVGALAAFAAGRLLGRDFVASSSRLAGADAWLSARGVWGVLVLRILPVAPFGLVSYGLGTTGIGIRSYLLGTALGAAPSTVVYAYLGASAMRPDSVEFALSVVAALLLVVSGAVASAWARRRRHAGRQTARPPPTSSRSPRSVADNYPDRLTLRKRTGSQDRP